jgi:hypothetical protein
MAVPMPAVVVLIVCKTVLIGSDQNTEFTGWENREWAYENSKMICRRQEVDMFDVSEAQGADPMPFNVMACMAASIRLAAQWDVEHKDYKTWRTACPVPIKNFGADGIQATPDDEVVGWSLPSCGHADTVICETDSAI